MLFRIGDIVEHKTFGLGTVQKSNKDNTQVLFENTNEIKLINNKFLTFVKKVKPVEKKVNEFKIYPTDYSEIDAISVQSKELADYLKKNKVDGNLYLDVSLFDDKDRKFSFLVSSKGVTVFEYVKFEKELFNMMKDILIDSFEASKKSLVEKITNHLSLSNELVSNNKLILSIEHALFIDNSKEWIKPSLSENIRILANDIPFQDSRKPQLLDRHIKIIANMLAPQYIVVLTRNSNHLNPRLKNMISSTSRANGIELSILRDEQINTLYGLQNGIELILANAGAGKSVILLAKAYELCSLNYENVLLTCYNSNLAEEYRYKSEECDQKPKRTLCLLP